MRDGVAWWACRASNRVMARIGDLSESGDRANVERAYVGDLVTHTTEHGAENSLRLVSHSVEGSWPDTELRLVIRFGWSPALYGVRNRVWAENAISEIGTERAVTYTWLRLQEMALTRVDVPTPSPGDDGVTWMDLWPDDEV